MALHCDHHGDGNGDDPCGARYAGPLGRAGARAWHVAAALLAQIAREREIEEIFASERRAVRLDAQNPAALEEMRLWEATLEDGID